MQKQLCILLLFCSFHINAQFGKNCEITQLKINLINPGIEYERGLGVNTTLDIKAGLQIALDPALEEPLEEVDLFPALALQYRYYYNFERRGRNGRQIYGNSANYVAPATAVFYPGSRTVANAEIRGIIAYGGLVTGLQRSYNSGFNFSVDVGAAYHVGPFKGSMLPVANLSIGWIISEKRWCVGK
ncbi:MAG: hypothetical protein AAFZ89_07795 [Bacteroidota bacterium]